MGRIDEFSLAISPLKQSPRRIWVYLPDGYDDFRRKKYPVLYMFDGHNLFDDNLATYGKSWGLKEYLDNTHMQLVIIGQDCNHTGNRRLEEYCPVEIPKGALFDNGVKSNRMKFQGKITAEWFAKKLKPECEKRYRIDSDRKNVGIAGSSMGGLMAMYMIARYNDVYSKAACVSTTMDITTDQLYQEIMDSHMNRNTRIYMDFGSKEVRSKKKLMECIDDMLILNHAFQEKGVNTFPNLVVGGTHSEASWETIVPLFLEYLYPQLYH